VGVLEKLAEATREKFDSLGSRSVLRIGNKSLSELTDAELEAELAQRRRRRARSRGVGVGEAQRTRPMAQAVRRYERRRELKQWYANLELEPGASAAEIEEAYRRLLRKYDPAKHEGDPEKHRVATTLVKGLTEARRGLLDHLASER